jgi:hypothetical protein
MNQVFARLRKSRETENRSKKKQHAGPRVWLWMMGIAALALVLALPLNMALAVYEADLFEIGEPWNDPQSGSANIIDDDNGLVQVPDWVNIPFDENGNGDVSNLPGGVAARFIKDGLAVKGLTDDTAFTGSKNDDLHADWQWVAAGNVPAKNDLSNVYFYTATNGDNDLSLFAGLERIVPNGDSHVDIEINQNELILNPDGTFSGEKMDGDLLLVMDFLKGGDLGSFEIRKWQAGAWTDPLDGVTGEGCNTDKTACAFNNDEAIWNGGLWESYDKGGNPGNQ